MHTDRPQAVRLATLFPEQGRYQPMSDADLIDPKHPWIDDPSDVPGGMNWLESFFDPTGETSRVHFTRGWTALFFTRLLFLIFTSALVFIMMSAGAEDPQAFSPPPWGFPALVTLTAMMSMILHVRRLANARRSPLWALLVLAPVLLGAGAFMTGTAQGAQEYDKKVSAWEARQNPARSQAGDQAGEGDDNEERQVERGTERRGSKDSFDPTKTSQRAFAIDAGIQRASLPWALSSLAVMLWSLLWVGRLPNGGGAIRSRFEPERPYKAD
jgi:uncharacterized membrane protein YhaH (DUF805 family)